LMRRKRRYSKAACAPDAVLCVTNVTRYITDAFLIQENAVLAEAKRWDEWRAKLQEKQLDAQACVKKAEVRHIALLCNTFRDIKVGAELFHFRRSSLWHWTRPAKFTYSVQVKTTSTAAPPFHLGVYAAAAEFSEL
jgi:hypothetical protein